MPEQTLIVHTVSDVPGLLQSIKALIANNVIAEQDGSTIGAGENEIQVESGYCYLVGDQVIIWDSRKEDDDTAFKTYITEIDYYNAILTVNDAFPKSIEFPRIQKLISDTYVKAVYPFDPPAKSIFPCITVNGDILETYPLALGGTSSTVYSIQVSTYSHAAEYETANNQAWQIERQIENALFKKISPDDCRQQIWKSSIGGVRQHQDIDDNSTLKVVTIDYELEEVIQRFADVTRPLYDLWGVY